MSKASPGLSWPWSAPRALLLPSPPKPWPLAVAVALVGLLALAPLAALALVASQGQGLAGLELGNRGLTPLANTLTLVFGVGCAGGLIGEGVEIINMPKTGLPVPATRQRAIAETGERGARLHKVSLWTLACRH